MTRDHFLGDNGAMERRWSVVPHTVFNSPAPGSAIGQRWRFDIDDNWEWLEVHYWSNGGIDMVAPNGQIIVDLHYRHQSTHRHLPVQNPTTLALISNIANANMVLRLMRQSQNVHLGHIEASTSDGTSLYGALSLSGGAVEIVNAAGNSQVGSVVAG